MIVAIESHQGAIDMQVTTIGLDIAKNVFQVHGIDAAEKVVVRKQLRRSQVLEFFKALPPCLIGMEACASAHYWARELTKLGHKVRLMPARDVKARARAKCLGPISGSHQGQRPLRLHRDRGNPPCENRPYTWLHPNASQKSQICSCNAGTVHTWPIAALSATQRYACNWG